jgi:hypothetical protein
MDNLELMFADADEKQKAEEAKRPKPRKAPVRENVVQGNTRTQLGRARAYEPWEGTWHCTTHGHNKFYQITKRTDGTVLLRWGKIGANGQTKIVSQTKAIEQASKREGKGYYKVT